MSLRNDLKNDAMGGYPLKRAVQNGSVNIQKIMNAFTAHTSTDNYHFIF